MSQKRSLDGIGDEDRRVFRLFKILVRVGRQALHFVFIRGCKKESGETLKHYLTIKKGMENRHYKNIYNKPMRDKINDDPDGDSYDISLLYACIRWTCELSEDAEEWLEGKGNLESLCTKLKNMRNGICHGDQELESDDAMIEKCNEITKLLEDIIKLTGIKFIIHDEVKNKLKEIHEEISDIMKAPLGEEHLHAVTLFKKEQEKAIRETGKNELSELYKDISKIDPASFVTKKEQLLVENVFTELEVVCENTEDSYKIEYKDLLDLFEVKTEYGKKPKIIIVEGDAGAGKTTLTKLMLSDWAEKSTIFEALKEYDLVFRAEGKKRISTYLELIQGLLPTASYKFDDNNLVSFVNQMKVLLIMDGFDELNKESEKLIRELLDMQIPKSGGNLQLLITTRPGKLSDLRSILNPNHRQIHTKLRGISVNKRVEFVTKLHNEMIKEKQSYQDTQKLIDLLKKSQAHLGEHYRLPLNLTLLTYLWASDPSKVNPETTATGLYIAFMELIESRLQDRLMGQLGVVKLSKDKCQKVVKEFQEQLYSVSLDTLASNSMQLSTKSEEILRKECEKLEVPFTELFEAFLVVEKEWSSSGYKTELTVPHKSILEFYAANHFMAYIKTRNDEQIDEVMSQLKMIGKTEDEIWEFLNIPKEEKKSLSKICKNLLNTDKKLKNYENMFLHLTGLLAHQCPNILDENCDELVRILEDAAFTGTKWLDLLVEAKCNDKLASLLVPLHDIQLIIRDGHMGAAIVLFKHLDDRTPTQVILENEVTYIPRLDEMLCQLSKRNCAVEIFFKHQWKNKDYGTSDEHLRKLLPEDCTNQQCRVIRFTGLLNNLSCLPDITSDFKIAFISTEHARQLLLEINNLVKHRDISYIGIHVMSGVMPDGLLPMPILKPLKRECGSLWLSKVDEDWKAKCEVIRALLPDGGMFHSITFPQSNFTDSKCAMILKYLHELNVKVSKKGIRFSSNIINKDQLNNHKTAAMQYFGCALYCMDESSMW